MMMTSLVIGIVLTILILILSIFTITRGYGYKHTVDPLEVKDYEVKSVEQKK